MRSELEKFLLLSRSINRFSCEMEDFSVYIWKLKFWSHCTVRIFVYNIDDFDMLSLILSFWGSYLSFIFGFSRLYFVFSMYSHVIRNKSKELKKRRNSPTGALGCSCVVVEYLSCALQWRGGA